LVAIFNISLAYHIVSIKIGKMARNKPYGDSARKGAVRGRSQIQNPKTGLWTKRDRNTGKFMDVKTTNASPFKGVRREK
jgi:hypothetical protein